MDDALKNISGESRAVIEAVLHLVATLKNQPGFDSDAFAAEMRARMNEVPPEMETALVVLAAAAAVPARATRTRDRTRRTSLLKR